MASDDTTAIEEKNRKRQRFYRRILRFLARVLGLVFTRTTVTGLENIPTKGPVLFCANHFSTYDAVLMLTYLPEHAQFVGPGDFKLLWPANIVVENVGIIMVARGSIDRTSLKQMEQVLKHGGLLGLFPEGGTWEKGLEDVKSGAAYLSLTTSASIVPIAIGGTYQVWSKIARLQRPKISIHFGKMLPPVRVSGDRKTRQDELQAASVELMRIIYAMLPLPDQEFYDLIPRQRFHAELDFMPELVIGEVLPALPGLAELVSKPNLFSPLHRNAGLPLRPFVQRLGRYTPAYEFEEAIRALQCALQNEFKGYLEYRLGETKAGWVYADLEAFLPVVAQAVKADTNIRFIPRVTLEEAAS